MHEGPLTWTTETGTREGTVLIRLTGSWTLENCSVFQHEFWALKPAVLIVDMCEVPYIDSAGVGVLVQGHVSALNGGRLLLIAGVTNHVMALFYLIKVNGILQMYPTVSEAEKAALRRKKR